jgi:hypothetical protein
MITSLVDVRVTPLLPTHLKRPAALKKIVSLVEQSASNSLNITYVISSPPVYHSFFVCSWHLIGGGEP